MWIRRPTLLQARMPSMRPNPSVPRRSTPPAQGSTPAAPDAASPHGPAKPASAAPQVVGAGRAEVSTARAGGFHESSYELQSGLQVSESEWPDDVTVPGKLGER